MSALCFDIFTHMIEEDEKLFYTMNHYKKEGVLLKKRKKVFRFIKQVCENIKCPNKVKFLSILYFDIYFAKIDCSLLTTDLLTSLLSLIINLAIKVEGGVYEENQHHPTIAEISKFTYISEEVLFKLERKILNTLNWKTSFVSPEDLIYLFFETHLKELLGEKEIQVALDVSTYFYKHLFLFDENPYQFTGVSIAICCISQALIEMDKKNELNQFVKSAKKQELVDGDVLNNCWNELQRKINEFVEEKEA